MSLTAIFRLEVLQGYFAEISNTFSQNLRNCKNDFVIGDHAMFIITSKEELILFMCRPH